MSSPPLNDRFEDLRELGAGGQGVVFAARDRVSNREVAIKLLGASDPVDAMRLRAEFARLSSLSHEHVVSVFDIDTVQTALDVGDLKVARGQLFFTAELIEGVSLEAWVKGWATASPTPDALLTVLDQLASALAHVHRNGVVHCDVKPENILISNERGAMLLDFGLSLRRGDTGLARGTLAFMDGRALAGEPDPQSDLHALGVSVYRSLGGKAPYPHRDPQTLISALTLGAPATLASLCPALPAPLCELIDALIRDSSRPRSANALLERIWSTAEALGLPVRRRALKRGAGRGRLVGRQDVVTEDWRRCSI